MAERGAAALLDAMLPEFTRLEAHAIGEAMKEASEEDREYDGRAVEPTRSVMRGRQTRTHAAKGRGRVQTGRAEGAGEAHGRRHQRAGGAGACRQRRTAPATPRVQKLCAVKLAGVLQYTICLYAAWAAELLPPQGEQATASQ